LGRFVPTVLGILAYLVYRDQPPIAAKVIADGKVVFTRDDIFAGMNVFQRYGLMQYGSVYGHGAYLGPDFTTEYLHKSAELLIQAYEAAPSGKLSARERVATELHENTTTRLRTRSHGADRGPQRTPGW
jgi:nitric oxide reductase subunit B